MVVVYAVALSLLTTRRFAWLLGAVIPIVLAGAWLFAAHQQDPTHVRQTILGAEIVGRVADESPEGIAKPVYFSAMWFVSKALPWGGLALIGGGLWLARRRFDPAYLPAMLWLAIVLAMLSIPAGKRMDYLVPAYAPGAIATAYALLTLKKLDLLPRLASRLANVSVVLPLLIAVGLAYLHLTRFHESREHWSDRAVAFARQVRPVINDEPTLVLVRGKHPIPVLLGRHQGSYLTPADIQRSTWVILPEVTGLAPRVLSEPVPIGFETLERRQLARLGLYRTSDIPLQTLVEQQKRVAEWTRDENPYRAPDTVFGVE